MRKLIAITIALLISAQALATPPKQNQGQAQGQGQSSDNENNNDNYNRADGGNAYASGGDAYQGQSSNNENENDNFNYNRSDSDSTAISGSRSGASSDNTNLVGVGVGVHVSGDETNITDGDVSQSVNDGDVNVSDNSSVTVEGDTTTYDLPTHSAYAPQAYGSNCGSVIGAASNDGSNSFSLGLPIPRWLSAQTRDCERERSSSAFAQLGLKQMAAETLCHNGSTARAHGGKAACLSKVRNTFADRREAELNALREVYEEELLSRSIQHEAAMLEKDRQVAKARKRMEQTFAQQMTK